MNWSPQRGGGGVRGGWTGWLIVSLNHRRVLSSYILTVSLSTQTRCSYGNLPDPGKWLRNVDKSLSDSFCSYSTSKQLAITKSRWVWRSLHIHSIGQGMYVGQSASAAATFCFWHSDLKWMTHSPSKWKLNSMPRSIYSIPFSGAPGNFWRLNVLTWSILDDRPLSPVCLTDCSPQPENRIISLQTCGFSVWTTHLSVRSLQ